MVVVGNVVRVGPLKNVRWERFAQLVCKKNSYAEAYRQCGFADNRHSAAKLARHPTVGARISEIHSQHRQIELSAETRAIEKAVMSRTEVLLELSKMGRVNVTDLLDLSDPENPTIDFSKLTPAHAAAIADITVKEYHDKEGNVIGKKTSVKYHDKGKALQLLGTHHGLFVHRVANLNLNMHLTGDEDQY